MTNPRFKFIDLFAGIGGFHQAMKSNGGECILASEIDKYAIESYLTNYGTDSNLDVTKLDISTLGEYDVLCAGIPCQSFSKAGNQGGLDDARGTLFFHVANIADKTKPKYILIENVANLVRHDNGRTWDIITNTLTELGYRVPTLPILISPMDLGIPQSRDRVFIPCVRNDISDKPFELTVPSISKYQPSDILLDDVDDDYNISPWESVILEFWDEFIRGVKETTIGFPVWFDYLNDEFQDTPELPRWKRDIIDKNKRLYCNNKEFIDTWILSNEFVLEHISPTEKKFEWQMGDNYHSLFQGIIQFRPSGIRVRKPNAFPALVAMVHIPIVGWLRRRITPRECARMQSFPDDFILTTNDKQAYKQLGNAVNVDVVKYVFENTILKHMTKDLTDYVESEGE